MPDFRVGEQLYQTWQEVVEQKIEVPTFPVRGAGQIEHPFAFPASRAIERIRGSTGRIDAILLRRQDAVRGRIEIRIEPIEATVSRLTVRILNQTPVPPNDLENQSAILLRTFTSTHTILQTEGG